MTIYRRRLASSFTALQSTLRKHLDAIAGGNQAALTGLDEDAPDDELGEEEVLDADEVGDLEREALAAEERADIEDLLGRIAQLPPDSKLASLKRALAELRQDGYEQAMVFTQYADTMDFLRGELQKDSAMKLMCFSGRGGEIPAADGGWRQISRDDAKRRFRDGEAHVLLCTDAAAEGLNFQFCGALVNYDMPWNPMRVEQRIGRIDRLGQRHGIIRIINLHYEDTVETDVYRALRDRIGLFQSVVGRLAAHPGPHAADDFGNRALRWKTQPAGSGRVGGQDPAGGSGSGTKGIRPRRRDRARPRHAGAAALAGHDARPGPDHRSPRPDAARHRNPPDGASGIQPPGAGHGSAPTGDHRPGILSRKTPAASNSGRQAARCLSRRSSQRGIICQASRP